MSDSGEDAFFWRFVGLVVLLAIILIITITAIVATQL